MRLMATSKKVKQRRKRTRELNVVLSFPQGILLIVSFLFMGITWTVGGQSGYSSGLGTVIPWVIGSLAVVSGVFVAYVKGNQRKFDVLIALVIFSVIDYGVMPISSWAFGSVSVSGFIIVLSLGAYLTYTIKISEIRIVTRTRRMLSLIETEVLPFHPLRVGLT